jgi:phage RecT family recombinase
MTIQDLAERQTEIEQAAPQSTLRDALVSKSDLFDAALPDHINVETFLADAATVIQYNPELLAIMSNPKTRPSLFGALYSIATLGLRVTPTLGEAWIVPMYNREVGAKLATFWMGYKGWQKLWRQTGQVGRIDIGYAWPGEITKDYKELGPDGFGYYFRIEELVDRPLWPASVPTEESFVNGEHDPGVVFYAIVEGVNGGTSLVNKISARGALAHYLKTHDAPSNPPSWMKAKLNVHGRMPTAWDDWWTEMASISALRKMVGTMDVSVELRRAIANEGTVRTNLQYKAIDSPTAVAYSAPAIEATTSEDHLMLWRTSEGASNDAIRVAENMSEEQAAMLAESLERHGIPPGTHFAHALDSLSASLNVNRDTVLSLLAVEQEAPAPLTSDETVDEEPEEEPMMKILSALRELQEYAKHVGLGPSGVRKWDILSAIAAHLHCSLETADAHVKDWAG